MLANHHCCSKCHCPLCHGVELSAYHQDKKRSYVHCQQCHLVFVPRQFHLTIEQEKAEYDKHDNLALDDGYRRFLNRTLMPLLTEVKHRFGEAAIGLDFGCGEGQHLSAMAREQGVKILNYDLYYHDCAENLQRSYEFVVLTEVIEHLLDARRIWLQLTSLLKPGGILAMMTKRVRNPEAFSTWHYKNDPTHIAFYSDTTFRYVADWLNMELQVIANDVVFFIAPD